MKRNLIVASLSGALLLGSLGGASAGSGFDPTTWTNSPTSGPSPNPTHQVSGENCFFEDEPIERIEPAGWAAVLGGRFFAGSRVRVVLRNKADTADIPGSERFYDVTQPNGGQGGDWGGVFPIPSGLSPGVYPLEAYCQLGASEPTRAGLGPTTLGGFVVFDEEQYNDRSYTVVAESDPGEPVEAEVTFTG